MGLFSRTADVPALAAKRDLEGLVKALKDDGSRDQAMEAIVTLDDPAVVRPLEKLGAKLLTGTDSNGIAVKTLRKLGPNTALEPLLELCAEGSRVALRVVVSFGEDVALSPLVELRGHESPRAAQMAYRGLLGLRTPMAMAAVVEGLEQGPNQVEALRSVERLWKGNEPEVARASFAPFRAEPLQPDAEDVKLSNDILRGLAKRVSENLVDSDEPIATFVELLSDPADNVRMAAAILLVQSLPKDGLDQPDPRMADALERACADEFDGVRLIASDALSRQNDPRAVKQLMLLLDEREEIAAQAMLSIAILAERSGLPNEEGKLIVARYEDEGTKSKLGPNLAVAAGLVKQQARQHR